MTTVNASDIEKTMAHYLDEVLDEPILIEKIHTPFAVLLSYNEYERLKSFEDAYWAEKALKAESDGYIGQEESLKFIQVANGAET